MTSESVGWESFANWGHACGGRWWWLVGWGGRGGEWLYGLCGEVVPSETCGWLVVSAMGWWGGRAKVREVLCR